MSNSGIDEWLVPGDRDRGSVSLRVGITVILQPTTRPKNGPENGWTRLHLGYLTIPYPARFLQISSNVFFKYDVWPTKVLRNYCNWEQFRRTMSTLLADAGTVTKSGSQIYYSDVIMSAMATLITGVSIVYSTVCSSTDQRKYQSSALLALVRGIHRFPVYSPHKGPVTRKMFPFDDVIMT